MIRDIRDYRVTHNYNVNEITIVFNMYVMLTFSRIEQLYFLYVSKIRMEKFYSTFIFFTEYPKDTSFNRIIVTSVCHNTSERIEC